MHCHSSKDFVVAVDAVAGFQEDSGLSFPQLQLFCIVLASKTLQTLPKEEEEEEEKHNRVVGLGQNPLQLACFAPDFPSTGPRKT